MTDEITREYAMRLAIDAHAGPPDTRCERIADAILQAVQESAIARARKAGKAPHRTRGLAGSTPATILAVSMAGCEARMRKREEAARAGLKHPPAIA